MGRSEQIGPSSLATKWSAPLDMPTVCSGACNPGGPVVAADGTIYVGGSGRPLRASRGRLTRLEVPAPRAQANDESPAIGRDGTIYIGCRDPHGSTRSRHKE